MSKSFEVLSGFGYEVAAYLGDWNIADVLKKSPEQLRML